MRQPLDSRQQSVRKSYILLFFDSFSPDQKLNSYFVFNS